MLRRLSTLAAAVSLMVCVTTCVLWVRSYWVTDNLVWLDGAIWRPANYDGPIIRHKRSLSTARGGLLAQSVYREWQAWREFPEQGEPGVRWERSPPAGYPILGWVYDPTYMRGGRYAGLGFELFRWIPRDVTALDYNKWITSVTVPLPGVAAVSAVLPAIWGRSARQRRTAARRVWRGTAPRAGTASGVALIGARSAGRCRRTNRS